MSRLSKERQLAIIRAKQRQDEFVKSLDTYDWEGNGYADKFAWLREMYGPGRDDDLLMKCIKQFDVEGLTSG